MNQYVELKHDKNYNAKELTAKVSCNNMSVLSYNYTLNQNKIFNDKINFTTCQMNNDFHNNINDIKNNESKLLRGFSIDKKNCIYKRPHYNDGKWKKQFNDDLYDDKNLFNYQSKAKGRNDIISCDYKKILLPDSCDNGPYFLYTDTFTNDYYNCLI